jgi:hypothetical protein
MVWAEPIPYKTGCSSIPQSGIEDRGRHRSSMLCIEDWVAPLNLAELSLHAAYFIKKCGIDLISPPARGHPRL